MTQRKSLIALILVIVISLSLIAFVQLAKNSSFNISLAAPMSPQTSFSQITFLDVAKATPSQILGNSTRAEIYSYIVANPGVQFRGICAGLGIAIGTAEFHLGVLKKAGLISFLCDGKYKRFFANKKFSLPEMKLISILRHQTIGEILRIIASEKTVSHSRLALDLSITSQGLTWQMNQLRKEGIIKEICEGIKVSYSLNGELVKTLPELLCVIKTK